MIIEPLNREETIKNVGTAFDREGTIKQVGTAFEEMPTGLTPQQEAAFKRVQTAFSSQAGKDIVDQKRETTEKITPPPIIPTEPPKPTTPTPTKPTGISFEDIVAAGGNYADYDRQADGSYLPRPKTAEEIQLATEKTQMETAKAELEAEKNRLRNLDISQDPAFQRMSAGISSQWDARVADMERANASRKASLTQTGFRVGGRYTTSFEGVITAEEREGISRIGDLQSQKQSALIQAENAYRNQKWIEYAKFVDLAEENYNNEQKEFDALNKIVIEENKKRTEMMNMETKKTIIGDAIYDSFANKITDVAQIYADLRAKGISVTPKEVEETLNSFIPKPSKETIKNAYEFGKDDVGKLISVGFTGEEIQTTQDIFNKYGLYTPIPEAGNKSLVDILPVNQLKTIKEILYPPPKEVKGVNTGIEGNFSDMANGLRVARMAFGSGRALSDKDRDFGIELYNKGASEGLGVYDVVDKTFGFVIANEEDKPLASGLRNVLLNIDGQKGMSDYDFEGLARLVNSGQDMMAVRKVENIALEKAQKLVGISDFVAEADVKYVQDKVIEVKDLLGEGLFDEVGAFTGSFDRWLSTKFGFGQANKIKAKITSLTADLVNKRAGSNVTETEWKRLVSPNIPQMNDSGKAFKDKLDELIGDVLTRYNSERIMVSLPSVNQKNILNPDTRISLYAGVENLNPLDLSDNNPLGI